LHEFDAAPWLLDGKLPKDARRANMGIGHKCSQRRLRTSGSSRTEKSAQSKAGCGHESLEQSSAQQPLATSTGVVQIRLAEQLLEAHPQVPAAAAWPAPAPEWPWPVAVDQAQHDVTPQKTAHVRRDVDPMQTTPEKLEMRRAPNCGQDIIIDSCEQQQPPYQMFDACDTSGSGNALCLITCAMSVCPAQPLPRHPGRRSAVCQRHLTALPGWSHHHAASGYLRHPVLSDFTMLPDCNINRLVLSIPDTCALSAMLALRLGQSHKLICG